MGERSLEQRIIDLEYIVQTQGVIINELREQIEDAQPAEKVPAER